jgi:hypothetical protein
MTKLVQKTETTTAMAVATTLEGAGLNTQDMILPALAIRQNSYVKDRMKPFRSGEVILFPNTEAVASETKRLAFIPVAIEKLYRICDISGKQARTVGWEPWDVDQEWEFQRGGLLHRRDKSYVAHILLREGLDAQSQMLERAKKGEMVDPSDFALPARVVFTRGSLNAGKVLSTHFEMSRAIKQTPAAIMFELYTKEFKNDKGTFYVFECNKVTDQKLKFTPKEILPIADFWATTMLNAATKFKADQEAETEEVAVTATKVETEEF